MKDYPSISRVVRYGVPIYAFDKLDGSLIRAEWSRKKGFYKFGRRNGLLDDSNPFLPQARGIVEKKYAEALSRIFRDARYQKATAFFELWGPHSFAGNHDPSEKQDLTLFDVVSDNRGLMEPRDFLRTFDSVDHARLLYQGNFTVPLEEQIRAGALGGMTFEGVVCKGSYVSPGLPLMFKTKSQAWLDRLRSICKDEVEFEKLR